MQTYKHWAFAVCSVLFCITQAIADDKRALSIPSDYVRLTAEIRGTLHVEKDAVRVRVYLGGGCLMSFYDDWVLDFGKNNELQKMAVKWNAKTVVVTGIPPGRPFIGFGGKVTESPQILSVKTLTEALAK